MKTEERVSVNQDRSTPPTPAGRATRIGAIGWLASIQSIGLAVIVGWDGTPIWRATRVLAVLTITGLALIGTHRASRAGRGAVALALGVAGTVAGGGVASAELAKAGVTVTTVAAATALVTGLALLVAGSVTLIRSMLRWWRLLAIPAGLALLVFLLYPFTVAVNATNRPAGRLGARTPGDVGLTASEVTFPTPDGAQLSAWWVPGSNGAAIVVLHGAGSTRTAVLDHAAVLASHGYATLLMDSRGHGRSEGQSMDFGWYGPADISGAITFLEHQPAVDRIGVLGLSMGGESALSAAGSDRRIEAVVAEGVTGMQEADHGWLPGGVNGAIERGLEWVQFTAADLMSGASRPMPMRDAIVASTPTPFLIVAGGATHDEANAGRWLRSASPDRVELWVVPAAGHTGGLATEPKGWERRVVGFLDEMLLLG